MLATMAPAVVAKGQWLKCEMTANGAYRASATELVVDYQAGDTRMWVFDNLMKH